jgi:hypothetical protein
LTNNSIGGDGRVGYHHSEETKNKMSLVAKGRKMPSRKGKLHSEITKQKIRNSKIGKSFHTTEWKILMSKKLKGRKISEKCINSLIQRNIDRGIKNIKEIDKHKKEIIEEINNGASIKDLSLLIKKPIRRYLKLNNLFEMAKRNGNIKKGIIK